MPCCEIPTFPLILCEQLLMALLKYRPAVGVSWRPWCYFVLWIKGIPYIAFLNQSIKIKVKTICEQIKSGVSRRPFGYVLGGSIAKQIEPLRHWFFFFFSLGIQYWAKRKYWVVSNQGRKWDWSYWWSLMHTGGTRRPHKVHWSQRPDGCPLHEFWIKLALDEFEMWYLCSKAIGIQ